MTTSLFRPQPLPAARLQPGAGLLVLLLHVGLLWLANLYWPLGTVMPGSVQNKNLEAVAQTFDVRGSRSGVASPADPQAIINFGRQHFGRAEAMLALPQTPPQKTLK